jgi:hypothetical protein
VAQALLAYDPLHVLGQRDGVNTIRRL